MRNGAFRWFMVAGFVALALLGAGCTGADEPPTRTVAFRPEPEVAPIERLGRWDGTTFVPIAAGSVRTGDLYVLVHGWAPGYLDAVEDFPGPGPLLAWSPRAVNDLGQSMITEFLPLAAAITRDDPGATILAFSWIDDSATALSPFAAWHSEARTDLNGQRLVAALGQAFGPGYLDGGGRVHLIGHSHGAKVATVAGIAMERPPAQLTLLDSPENVLAQLPDAANHLEGYLPLLPIGRGPGKTFVDNYFSITGERYSTFAALESVVDVQLFPDQFGKLDIDSLIARHEYPVDWYTKSAEDLAAGVGLAWSPLVGKPPDCVACDFRQAWLRSGGGVNRADQLRLVEVPDDVPRTQPRRRLEVEALRGPSPSSRVPNGIKLSTPRPRLWQVAFDKETTDLAIEFDSRFTDPGPGAQLGVWLDDRQVLTTAADWSGATGNHAVVDVSSLDVGRHTLTAVLTTPARGRDASVILGGFFMESQAGVTSPGKPLSDNAKLALLALVLFAIIGVMAGLLRRHERKT